MRNKRLLTSLMMTLGLLAGAASITSADPSGSVVDAAAADSDVGQVSFHPVAGGETVNGKGGGKPPTAPTATPEPTPVPCTGCPEMHVSVVVASYGSNSNDTYGSCRAAIVDAGGNLLEGVDVTIEKTDPWAGQYTGTTFELDPGLANYQVRIVHRKPDKNACGKRGNPETMTCTVVGAYHPDYTYTPGLNVQSSDTDSCNN